MDDFEAYLGTYLRAYNKADAIIDHIVWRDDT